MSMTPMPGEAQDASHAIRDALVAYLESNETDRGALARLEALPGGSEILARALALRAARAHFRRGGSTVAEFLQEKQEEREAEAERDLRRDAFHS